MEIEGEQIRINFFQDKSEGWNIIRMILQALRTGTREMHDFYPDFIFAIYKLTNSLILVTKIFTLLVFDNGVGCFFVGD